GVLALWAVGRGQGEQDAPAPPAARQVPVWSQAQRLEGFSPRAWSVAFSPDGQRLAVGSGDFFPGPGVLRLCEASSGKVLISQHTTHSVRCVAYSPDGQTLATAEHDGVARLRNAQTGEVVRELR